MSKYDDRLNDAEKISHLWNEQCKGMSTAWCIPWRGVCDVHKGYVIAKWGKLNQSYEMNGKTKIT